MSQRTPFQRINIQEAQGLLSRSDVLVLDVRDTKSYGRGHIRSARNVSIGNLWAVVEETPRTKPVLIYCYHGYASQEFAQVFSDFGFSCVYSLDGGYEAWRTSSAVPARIGPELSRWLMDQGFPPGEVNATIGNGTTPLMKASHMGETSVMRALIAAGAVLAARNADGNNALWLACVGDRLDAMDVLIETGIDIDNANDNGATALMYAASAGKAAVVERLLAAGADVTPESLDGFTALDMASTEDCLALLRRAGRARIAAIETASV